MQNRNSPQEIKLEPRPAIQFCQLIESIINAARTPIQKDCCFFSDGLSEPRAAYRRLTGAYRNIKKMIYEYESTREALEMSSEQREILDKSNAEIKALESEMEELQSAVEQRRSELEDQQRVIKEKIANRSMQAQIEINALEERRNKISQGMTNKNFFQKMRMRKSKKELRLIKSKIKTINADAERQKLEAELREAEEKLQNYTESFSDKIRIYKIKLQAAKDRVNGVALKFEHRKTEYNATVNKEMMEGVQSLNDQLLKFFDQIEKLKVGKKLSHKAEVLTKIAAENKGKSLKLLSGLLCPDYAGQDSSQKKSDEMLTQSEKSASVSQGQTFFSILSVSPPEKALAPSRLSAKLGGR